MSAEFTNATTDELYRTTGVLNYDANYAVRFWVRFPSLVTGSGSYRDVWEISSGANDYEYLAVLGNGTNANFDLGGSVGGSFTNITGATNLATGVWYDICIIRSANNSRILYLNGAQECNYTTTLSGRPAVDRLGFGSFRGTGSTAAAMWVAGYKEYNTNVALAVLRGERTQLLPRSYANLVACYPMRPGQRTRDFYRNQYTLSEGGTLADQPGPPVAFKVWTPVLPWTIPPAALTYEQEGFRWRNDDGSESGASWLAAQDTNITRGTLTNTRLRILVDTANQNPPSRRLRLQYRRVGDEGWRDLK